MPTRREMLERSAALAALLASAGWPQFAQAAFNRTAFDAKTVQDAIRAVGAGAIAESRDVTISGPDIAENGAVVPLSAATTLAGARQLMILVEKNPSALAAVFELSDAVDPSVSTRVKMSQSSDVYAVAILADGRAMYAKREVRVTQGGCG